MLLVDHLQKNKKRIQKFKEMGDTNYIYKNELDKAYFQHDMAYGDFKDLARRPAYDKVLRDKAFNIAKNPKYNGYQRGLASMVYKFFDKKSEGSSVNIEVKHTEQLAKQLTVHSGFKENIWGADLADAQLAR